MDYFNYRGRELFAEGVPLSALALKYGTPLYVYSKRTLRRHIREIKKVFRGRNTLICYACKANYNRAVIETVRGEGIGADCVSGGEIMLARKAGIVPQKIVFNGNGKTEEEIKLALKMKIKMINMDSVQELYTVSRLAKKLGIRPRVSFRVNPEIKVSTHPHIATGLKKSKFGIAYGDALRSYTLAKEIGAVDICGIHMHIGSQITDASAFGEALVKLVPLARRLAKEGIKLKYINAGGGLGVTYNRELPATLLKYSRTVLKYSAKIAPRLIIEPGRIITANAGILLTKVILNKTSGGKKFVIVDCGMNDLLRPSMYGAWHGVQPVLIREDRKKDFYTVAGPLCESGDVVAERRKLAGVFSGELLAVMSAGAYGYSMSSNYNLRPRPAEVMVDGTRARLIRNREKIEDLI